MPAPQHTPDDATHREINAAIEQAAATNNIDAANLATLSAHDLALILWTLEDTDDGRIRFTEPDPIGEAAAIVERTLVEVGWWSA